MANDKKDSIKDEKNNIKKQVNKRRKYYNNYEEYKYDVKQRRIISNYVLIIKDFNSTTTTKEQLTTIFNQSYIKIVFIDELINDLQMKTKTEPNEDTIMITMSKNKIIEPEQHIYTNNILEIQQKLLQSEEKNKQLEEKIRQLEEEIISLKSQKQPKSIKDYFGKK